MMDQRRKKILGDFDPSQPPPPIAPVPQGVHRPLWSVMIPTFNCAKYLRQTLESVLAQDPGPEQMQIEVVDDCSTKDDPEAVVQEIGKGRVNFFRKPKNEGAILNFNTCIERSRGHLIHILHGDDYILLGFYKRIEDATRDHLNLALFASRSFYVDEENVIMGVTERLRELEMGAHVVDNFFYSTPLQTPSIVMRRSFYENHGGFRPALVHTADCEMWTRAIANLGGFAMQEVLACYRMFAANDSGRLAQTGKNLQDLMQLNRLFAEQYPGFDRKRADRRVCDMAIQQADTFLQKGNLGAANANLNYWKQHAPASLRLRQFVGRIARHLFS